MTRYTPDTPRTALALCAIAVSALVAAVHAVRRLVDPVPLNHLGWVAV